MKERDIIKVVVTSVKPYGAFVKYENYKGLIHISMINGKYIKDINDYFKIGQEIYTEIVSIDEEKKQLKLSLKKFEFRSLNEKENQLEETGEGFNKLKEKLPIWIEYANNDIKKWKKFLNYIDKTKYRWYIW